MCSVGVCDDDKNMCVIIILCHDGLCDKGMCDEGTCDDDVCDDSVCYDVRDDGVCDGVCEYMSVMLWVL